MKSKFLLTLLAIALASSSASAVTVSESASAPTDYIIGQPDFSAVFSGVGKSPDQYSNEDYDNQIPPGQTFTTTQAFTLDGLTLKGFGDASGGSQNFTVVISSVSGTTLTHLDSETSTIPLVNSANDTDYVTFTLNTPVALAANTQYAFTVYSLNGWFGFAKSSTDVLSGGYAFDEGTVRGATTSGDQIKEVQNVDRTFFLEGSAVPEPSTWAMMLGGLVFLVAWQRRRLQS